MRRRNQILGLLVILALIVAGKLGGELYRWYAFGEERSQLRRLLGELETAGLEVVRTQLRADTLRAAIGEMDRALTEKKRGVAKYDRFADGGGLPSYVYDDYRAELDRYNSAVGQRNGRYNDWKEVIVRNQEAVHRFNLLADSMRAVAGRMGDPYYSVPTPAEIAARHGLLKLK